METIDKNEIRYREAQKQVKRIKGFYIHLAVYILVNGGLILAGTLGHHDKDFTEIDSYYTAFFWGIGLLAHGLSVFLPGLLLGKDWEERKIQEILDKRKN